MIGCIIQARMGSTRLPRKILEKIDEKYTVLDYTINQLKSCKKIDKIIVATTDEKEDDVVKKHLELNGIQYYRGSSENVLDRLQKRAIDRFEEQQARRGLQQAQRGQSYAIAGDVFLAVRRFLPDFKDLQGNAKVTLAVKRYPSDSQTTTALSPFTITTSTEKKDTRARGRFVNIKIENDATSESWRFGTMRLDVQPDGRR